MFSFFQTFVSMGARRVLPPVTILVVGTYVVKNRNQKPITDTPNEDHQPHCKNYNPAWPFKSSETNYEIAEKEYSHSPVEKYVATALGDELPTMRDELIELKHEGEGIVERHVHAWSKLNDWKVDPNGHLKEEIDPIRCEK